MSVSPGGAEVPKGRCHDGPAPATLQGVTQCLEHGRDSVSIFEHMNDVTD